MKKCKLDLSTQTLTLSAKFVEAMNNTKSEEYCYVRQLTHDFPNLTVVRKTHATPVRYHNSDGSKTAYQKNKNLTYKRMERFMSALPDGEKYLATYWDLREKAKAMCASPYAVVSAWFMKQFPLFRTNPLFYLDNLPKIISISAILETAKKKPSVDAAEGGKKTA